MPFVSPLPSYYFSEPLAAPADAIMLAVVSAGGEVVERIGAALEKEGVVARVRHGGTDRFVVERRGRRPDVVVLADGDHAADIHRIHRMLPQAHVVVVVGPDQPHELGTVLRQGVDGIVLDAELETTLALVVRCVCAGHISVPRTMRHALQVPALSYRERQILALLTAGLSNEEIASRMFLAESTVKGHLTSAFRRLGVRSRHEAVALILTADESLRRSVLTASSRSGDKTPPLGD